MFSGAKYSVELRNIAETPGMKVFDFDYHFYEPQFQCDFEEKFIDHYYFDEIGFETVGRFKQRLKSKLNMKMPYYEQLYKTELKAQDIDFLLNKDLRETFIRTLDKEDSVKGQDDTSSSSTNSSSNSATSDIKESNVADGVASAKLSDGYLTSVSNNSLKGTSSTTGKESIGKTSSQDSTGKETEKTEFISKGNIGVTSSAELLEKWRSVLINIDEMIIDDCRDLFMGIY